MGNGEILAFTIVANRAIASSLDPQSDEGILASKLVEILEVTMQIAKKTGFLNAPLPPDVQAPELPPQPWTPQGLLDWAATQEYGTHPAIENEGQAEDEGPDA